MRHRGMIAAETAASLLHEIVQNSQSGSVPGLSFVTLLLVPTFTPWLGRVIPTFFGLSNRMADLIAMRPNDEFYLMERVPKQI